MSRRTEGSDTLITGIHITQARCVCFPILVKRTDETGVLIIVSIVLPEARSVVRVAEVNIRRLERLAIVGVRIEDSDPQGDSPMFRYDDRVQQRRVSE